jgi:hypothetical protein
MKDVFRFAPAGELQAGKLHLAARRILAVFSTALSPRAASESLFRHGVYETQDEAQSSEDVDDCKKLA